MADEIIYTYILIKKDGTYLGCSKAPTEPPCGEPDKLEWIEWNKPLPEDIDTGEYKFKNGELIKI